MPHIKCLLPLECLLLDPECKTSDRAILICGSKRLKKQIDAPGTLSRGNVDPLLKQKTAFSVDLQYYILSVHLADCCGCQLTEMEENMSDKLFSFVLKSTDVKVSERSRITS